MRLKIIAAASIGAMVLLGAWTARTADLDAAGGTVVVASSTAAAWTAPAMPDAANPNRFTFDLGLARLYRQAAPSKPAVIWHRVALSPAVEPRLPRSAVPALAVTPADRTPLLAPQPEAADRHAAPAPPPPPAKRPVRLE